MANCIHNQLESLGQRYLKKTPEPRREKLDVDLVLKIVDHLAKQISEVFKPEFDFKTYVRRKPGATRRRFLKAYSQMLRGDRNITSNSKIAAFVKNERYYDEGKAPRMIMGRDPKFNIVYCRFIARLEDAFFQLPQVANSCNFKECGKKFGTLFSRCSSMFENDMSKYEATQRDFLLMLEHRVYDKVLAACGCLSETEDLKTVFAAKCIKPVVTGQGVKATFRWCRGSGDMDTSLGNGILNYITTMYFMIANFCSGDCKFSSCNCLFDSFVLKGDDSYGCAPKSSMTNTYAHFGLDAKLVYRPNGEYTEFCSGNFVRIADGEWFYVQKLRKMITSVSTCINRDIIQNGWLSHYLKSLGMMYKVIYAGIPYYEDFADMLLTADDKLGLNTELISGVSYGAWEAFKAGNTSSVDSCPETILDISEHNEMPIAQLEALRETFNNSAISLPPHLKRRCNRKNLTDKVDLHLCDSIATWVNRVELSKDARRIRRQLGKMQHHPRQTLDGMLSNTL